MTDLIVIAIVLAIVAAAALYVIRAKKRGVKCVGCPAGKSCSSGCANSSCGSCPSCASCDVASRGSGSTVR